MKTPDPIIEEIHAIREAFAAEHGNDLREIAAAAKAAGDKTGRRLETRPPRRIPPAKKAS